MVVAKRVAFRNERHQKAGKFFTVPPLQNLMATA
jgi:hypothetical protein